MKFKKDKKEKIETKAVDPTPEEKIKEDKPEIIVAPRCIMEIVENKETGGIDIVYSKNCSGGKIREVAGIIAVDGVRFRPKPEEKSEEKPEDETFFLKSDREKSKEKIKKEFKEKVLACESGKSESCESPES